uniref:MICOS complex subunit MIC13 n=1 Tax=Romanomermis culicivorax TaxID=13658 RepID=A0A915KHP7_ROMCU
MYANKDLVATDKLKLPPTFKRTAIRVAVPVTAVKLSYDYGVWGTNTSKSNETYERIKNVVLPGTIEYPKQLPRPDEVKESARLRWNSYIRCAFDSVENFDKIACSTYRKIKAKFSS